MVKRTVLTRQCKKIYDSSPAKKQRNTPKSRKKTPRKSKGKTLTSLQSVFTPSVECSPTKMVNSSIEATPINSSFISDGKCDTNKEAMSESVILLDDTIVENSEISTHHLADESCFIIDVEPTSDTEKSIYKFVNDDRIDKGKSSTDKQDDVPSNNIDTASSDVKATTSEISDTIPQTDDSCHSSVSLTTSHSSKSNCIALDDESTDASSSHLDDDDNDSSNKGEGKIKEITSEHVEMWNGIVVQMKNDGFLRENNNYKRSCTDECGPNKRFACDPGQSKPESWHVYKKNLGESSSSIDPSSKNIRLSAQNLASKRLINKENRGREDTNKEGTTNSIDENNCICIDDDSDSDIEFVNAFNPADRLIELSDDEGSVIFEDVIPPPKVIPLKTNFKRKIYGKKKKKTKTTPDLTEDDKLPSGSTVDADQDEKSKKVTKQMKRKRKAKEAKEAAKEAAKVAASGEKAKPLLRPIVIDGCNVAHGHGKKAGKMSVEGLQICYDYFHSRGHEVKVFLPSYKKFHPLTTNIQLLVEMESKGIVIFTPGRTVNGKKINSYDDRFILEYATLKGGIVITRDNYRDLYAEREEFRDTITNRLLQYTFVDDLIMFPDDPLGRSGPRLEEFLQFPTSKGSNKTNDPSSSKS